MGCGDCDNGDQGFRTTVERSVSDQAYDLYLKALYSESNAQDPKDFDAAVSLYQDAIKIEPTFALAHAGLARCHLAGFHYHAGKDLLQKALVHAQSAVREDPASAEAHQILGEVYSAGDSPLGIQELKRATELAPNSDDSYRKLCDEYIFNHQRDEAIAACQKAVTINPYNWRNHLALGSASHSELVEVRKVAEILPDDPIGYETAGLLYLNQRKWSDAIAQLKKALSLAPPSQDALILYFELGEAYFHLKRYDDAKSVLEKSVQLGAGEPFAKDLGGELWGNLGDSYRMLGRSDQAGTAYSRAISITLGKLKLNPRSTVIMSELGVLYAKKGDVTNALRYTKQARAIFPAGVDLMYAEVKVKTLNGKPEEALKTLRLALESGYLEKGHSVQEVLDDDDLQTLHELPQFAEMLNEFSKKEP